MRLVHTLERLAVAAAGGALADAGEGAFQQGDAMTGLYIGIDDAIEDIKDEYFAGVLADPVLGASPLMFPFTSPNVIAAQVSIAFDLRGESIVMPIVFSSNSIIKYITYCYAGSFIKRAIAGSITIKDRNISAEKGRYEAEFCFIEGEDEAVGRGARKYCSIETGNP